MGRNVSGSWFHWESQNFLSTAINWEGKLMSNKAAKFQKQQGGKHNQRCRVSPEKARYRDTKEAQAALKRLRARAKRELAELGETKFKMDRYYFCNGCNGYHTTKEDIGFGRGTKTFDLTLAT